MPQGVQGLRINAAMIFVNDYLVLCLLSRRADSPAAPLRGMTWTIRVHPMHARYIRCGWSGQIYFALQGVVLP